MTPSTEAYLDSIQKLKKVLNQAETILIGAGAGLSTSAGFVYDGERFQAHFSDFEKAYGIKDMYSGGFYPFASLEEFWAFFSRMIWINRYVNPPNPVYQKLLELVKDRDFFVITTNVDHCFQKTGFDKNRLFYTQGDYGLFQCSEPCHKKTYDNEDTIRKMVIAQGWEIDGDRNLILPEDVTLKMTVPKDLLPLCPVCGKPMTMNLRSDRRFVEDQGWHQASSRYSDFLQSTKDRRVLFLELGVGYNTPVIIKDPFCRMTAQNPKATYVCINNGEAICPKWVGEQSICINEDIGKVLKDIQIFPDRH